MSDIYLVSFKRKNFVPEDCSTFGKCDWEVRHLRAFFTFGLSFAKDGWAEELKRNRAVKVSSQKKRKRLRRGQAEEEVMWIRGTLLGSGSGSRTG